MFTASSTSFQRTGFEITSMLVACAGARPSGRESRLLEDLNTNCCTPRDSSHEVNDLICVDWFIYVQQQQQQRDSCPCSRSGEFVDISSIRIIWLASGWFHLVWLVYRGPGEKLLEELPDGTCVIARRFPFLRPDTTIVYRLRSWPHALLWHQHCALTSERNAGNSGAPSHRLGV